MDIVEIDVAVLAGGFGTRLSGLLPDTPKVLAPVAGRPFLDHLLSSLARQGASRVTLCLGYRSHAVVAYLSERRFPTLRVQTVVEPEPLGTAGAIAFAAGGFQNRPVLVMNGDTIVDANLAEFLAAHEQSGAEASMLCVSVPDAGRYGRVEIDSNDRVTRFVEKDPAAIGEAWINAGVYLFGARALERIARLKKGSLERDVLEKLPPSALHAFRVEGRFLDIGTPESLARAPEVLLPL